jgi:predicted N-acetyltransferase YhbS
MRVSLRPATAADAAACGRICYEAFNGIALEHRFPVDWRSEDVAVQVITSRLAHGQTYGVVAEAEGRIVGSAFLKEYRPVGAIGPVTVDPQWQGGKIGRWMMEHLLERARTAGLAGTRLVQAAYNLHSLSLYTKLGYQMREVLLCLGGEPIGTGIRAPKARLATEADAADCNALCLRLHGYARTEDVAEGLRLNAVTVTEREGRIAGYSTGVHFRGHTVAETNEDAMALISAAPFFPEPGLLMPAGNAELLRWAFDHGLRAIQPLTLMTHGFYQPPAGAFLPSIHA